MEINKIYNEDCLDTMKRMQDNFIDLTITSPPYDNIRSYNNDIDKTWNEEVWKPIIKELYRVTKQGGIVVWVVGDATINGSETGSSFKQALHFKEVGFNLHDTMIWDKNSSPYPEKVRYYQYFQYMFVFSKGKPNTINLIADKKNKEFGKFVHGSTRNTDGGFIKTKRKPIKEFGIRGNIWRQNVGLTNSTSDKIAFKHPAIFPEQLANDHIISWSNEEDLIYDCFMGSGTTAKMAIINNRNYIGSEISKEYCNIIEERIKNSQPSVSF